ncbi:MAG: leucine-rich repeat domain-containing protein [Bacilli bacterium]|nr:leucine-rich repeat domain-containing protein [Bacilli bacterium]
MEENEVKVETEKVEETAEIADKTPVESKKMSPKEKKATWIIGSIGVLLVAALTTVLVVGAVEDHKRSQQTPYYTIPWNTDLGGFYDENDKYISEGNGDYVKKKDSADNEYAHLRQVGTSTRARTFVLPTYVTIKEDEKENKYQVFTVGKEEGNIFHSGSENITAIYAQSLYKEIGAYSFSNLPSLTKVSLRSAPKGKQEIGNHAFYGDALLKDVTLADNLTAIGESAFEGCAALEQITLSGSLTKLGKNVFKDTSMRYINFNGNKTDWDTVTKEEGWDEGLHECYIQLLKEDQKVPYIYIE